MPANATVSPQDIELGIVEVQLAWNERTRRRRAGLPPHPWIVPIVELRGLVNAAEDLRSDELEQFQYPERPRDPERCRATR